MEKPTFHDIKKFKEGFAVCEADTLLEWLKQTLVFLWKAACKSSLECFINSSSKLLSQNKMISS
jgi:hypothetical protein